MSGDVLVIWVGVLLGCVLSAGLGFLFNSFTSTSARD
jgi:hypothetical protein